MAFSIVTPLQIAGKQAEGHAPIIAETTDGDRGVDVVLECLQNLYGQKLCASVMDTTLAQLATLGTAGTAYLYRSKTPRPADSNTIAVDVWLYVVRSVAEGGANTWTIRVTNNTNATTTGAVVVNGGATTTGTWWQLTSGPLIVDDNTYNEWEVECVAGSGGTRQVYAVVIMPSRSRSVLPTQVGGYSNGVNPIDITRTNTPAHLGVDILRDLNAMAVATWTANVGNIITSAMQFRQVGFYTTDAAGGGYDCFLRMILRVPAGCSGIQIFVLGGGVGTLRCYLAKGTNVEQLSTAALAAATWASVAMTTPLTTWGYGREIELRIDANADVESICAYWTDSVY